jgi:hypothetical protein
MLGRVSHPRFGLGFAISEHISGSGKPASVVVFDFNTSLERVMLDTFLSASAVPLPEIAKAKAARKPRKKKAEPEPEEPVSDELLIPKPSFSPLPQLDPLPDESSDMDEIVSEEEAEGYTETV